jgi:Group II intron, maturase-specific domain
MTFASAVKAARAWGFGHSIGHWHLISPRRAPERPLAGHKKAAIDPRCGRTIKRWRLHLWSGRTLADLAHAINAQVRGWINHYGRFYRRELIRTLKLINHYLMRWAMRKYKRLRGHPTRTARLLAAIAERERGLFAHVGIARPTAG